jgi:hypothetical protein
MSRFGMLTVAAVALLTVISVGNVSAQGHGHGHGNGKWGNKCEKFVNCHDARDGRWDNRGPQRRLSLRSRYRSPFETVRINRGDHNRRIYRDRFYVRNRRRY